MTNDELIKERISYLKGKNLLRLCTDPRDFTGFAIELKAHYAHMGLPTKYFQWWDGDLDFTELGLTSLGSTQMLPVKGSLYLSGNNLTSLKNCPMFVGGHFVCRENQLVTLEHGPLKVGKNYDCSLNKLITLQGSPKTIYQNFYCTENPLTSVEYGPTDIPNGCWHMMRTSIVNTNSFKNRTIKYELDLESSRYLVEAILPDTLKALCVKLHNCPNLAVLTSNSIENVEYDPKQLYVNFMKLNAQEFQTKSQTTKHRKIEL